MSFTSKVLYGVTCDRKIGVDLELIRPIPEAEQIVEHFFSKRGIASIRGFTPDKRLEAYNANTSEQEGITMDAIIERYRARIGDSGFVLTHPAGIRFDLTADEALELLQFLKVYIRTINTTERETNPELERIVIKEHEDHRGKDAKAAPASHSAC